MSFQTHPQNLSHPSQSHFSRSQIFSQSLSRCLSSTNEVTVQPTPLPRHLPWVVIVLLLQDKLEAFLSSHLCVCVFYFSSENFLIWV
ncbi:unnamed protein product [Ilex paraguariensis]|uniref:Uncharacterized protein n=1 Tax=Ilex paraguariensis TaxID=185542 RepID=A0ABC8RSF5_9AQUA